MDEKGLSVADLYYNLMNSDFLKMEIYNIRIGKSVHVILQVLYPTFLFFSFFFKRNYSSENSNNDPCKSYKATRREK